VPDAARGEGGDHQEGEHTGDGECERNIEKK
jgi:hypothetical protein